MFYVSEGLLEREKKYYNMVRQIKNFGYGEQFLRLADNLNIKAQSLLTHISIMFATIAAMMVVLRGAGGESITLLLLSIELILYMVLAFFCLIAVNITKPRSLLHCGDDPELAARELMRIVIRRRFCFHFAYYGTVVLTILLVGILVNEFFEGKHFFDFSTELEPA